MAARVIPAFAAALAVAAAACGSVETPGTTGTTTSGPGGSAGTTTSTSGTGGSPAAPAPLNHRASAAPCAAPRPPSDTGDGSGKCIKDVECTQGLNGRCVAYPGQPHACSYDACTADADCGSASVCDCRNPARFNANACFHGNCQIDADCGAGGYCSPSGVTVGPDCAFGVEQGSYGFFCHTAADECVNDADCPGPMGQPACLFQVAKARWACQQLICTD